MYNKSILDTIKKMLGLDSSYTAFDSDIIALINGVFASLGQMTNLCPRSFSIESSTSKWLDYSCNPVLLAMIIDYVYLKVRVIFDPPASSTIMEAYNKQIGEYEWRISNDMGGSS